MRTVIFVLALCLGDIARALGGESFMENVGGLLIIIFVCCIVFDILEFIKRMEE